MLQQESTGSAFVSTTAQGGLAGLSHAVSFVAGFSCTSKQGFVVFSVKVMVLAVRGGLQGAFSCSPVEGLVASVWQVVVV